MPKLDTSRRPRADYRFWLYDPEGDGLVYYRHQAERDQAAQVAIDHYLGDEWADEVELVAAGELTHFAQVINKQMRPPPDELDEEMCDGDGVEWPAGMDWCGHYTMAPLPNSKDQSCQN